MTCVEELPQGAALIVAATEHTPSPAVLLSWKEIIMMSGTKGARWEGVNENGGRPLCLRAGHKESRQEGKSVEHWGQALPKIAQGAAGAKADDLARMDALRRSCAQARRHVFLREYQGCRSTEGVANSQAALNSKDLCNVTDDKNRRRLLRSSRPFLLREHYPRRRA